MAANLCPSSTKAGTSHSTMSIGSREDWDEYFEEGLSKDPLGMRTPAPPTSVVIEEITRSPMDSRVLAPKKEQILLAIEGFAPLIFSLPGVTEPSPRFF